ADAINSSGELGRVRLPIGDGAGDGIDHDVFGVGIFLGGGGVTDPEHVAGALNEGVLKSGAGSDKGPVVDTSELDTFEHPVETLKRTARRGPEAVERIKGRWSARFEKRRRWEPRRLHFQLELPSRVLERVVGRVMRTEFGIEVAKNPDPYGFGHK